MLRPLQALSYQHKVAFMSERLLGVDHPDTISAYVREKQNVDPLMCGSDLVLSHLTTSSAWLSTAMLPSKPPQPFVFSTG